MVLGGVQSFFLGFNVFLSALGGCAPLLMLPAVHTGALTQALPWHGLSMHEGVFMIWRALNFEALRQRIAFVV